MIASTPERFSLLRQDGTGYWWTNRTTGENVALLLDGGRRETHNAQLYTVQCRVFHRGHPAVP